MLLPDVIRMRANRIGWPHPTAAVLLLLVFSLFGAIPLLQPGLYASHDGPLHVYRLQALDYALRDGAIYPRWASDFIFGYGSPIFNFLPMLPYYLAEAFHFVGFGYIDATKAAALLSLLTAPLAAWLYARSLLSPPAALMVGLAYAFIPYRFVDLYTRANFPEYMAFTWFPLLLWSFRKVVWDGERRWLPVAALVLAALLVTHTPSALLFLVVLAGHFVFWSGVRLRQGVSFEDSGLNAPTKPATAMKIGPLFRGGAALLLGGFIASGYLLPAFLEQDAVWRERLKIGEYFWLHFPEDGILGLFSTDFVHRYGLGLVEPDVFQYQIGLGQWALALLGGLILVWRWRWLHRLISLEGTLAVVVLAIAAFMCLAVATPIWKALPVLQTVQFPWRLLMLVALPSALLAGLTIETLASRWRAVAAVGLGLLLIANSIIGLRLPFTHFNEEQLTPPGLQVVESTFAVLGTTSNSEWVPHTVGIDPWADLLASPWSLAHLDGELGDPLAFITPAGVRAEVLSWRTSNRSLRVHADQPSPVAFNVFYFPGWRAWVDGAEAPVRPSEPEGFLMMDMPSGTHSVTLRIDRTPLQRTAELLSLAGLAATGLLLWVWRGRERRVWRAPRPGLPATLIAIVLLVAWVVLWRTYGASTRSEGPYQVVHRLEFPGATMEGYDLIGTSKHASGYPVARPGDELTFWLYWRPKSAASQSTHQFFVRLATNRKDWVLIPLLTHALDERSDLRRASGFLRIPLGLPPGTYQLEVGTLELPYEVGVGLVSYAHQDLFHGLSEAVLTSLLVTEPTFGATPDLRYPADLSFFGDIRLVAYEIAGAPASRRQLPALVPGGGPPAPSWSVTAGEKLRLTLLWKSQGDDLPPLTMVARLLNEEGDQYAATHELPAGGLYSSRYWEPRQLVRDVLNLYIPSDTPPGRYRLAIEVQGPDGTLSPVNADRTLGGAAVLGDVGLRSAPSSLLAPPDEPAMPILGAIELTKAEHASSMGPGERLHVMLHWWARAPEGRDLLARLTLEDEAGRAWGTVEGPLAGESYPTSRWRLNERLGHWFRLPVAAETPSGDYKLKLSLISLDGRELAEVDLGGVSVVGRARRFDIPPGLEPMNASFGEAMTLRGYHVGDEDQNATRGQLGQTVPVLLAWQAGGPSNRNLSVSVQIVDRAGRLVAQHDSIPQEGRAPVTGWLPGEVVEDHHFVPLPTELPPGEYSLQVVVYDSEDGQRLVIAEGRGSLFLQILTIEP